MSKTLHEAAITTRNARAKLTPGRAHWRSIDPDVHLGYRRAAHGGRWLVRWYLGDGAYRQETIATADDALDADGVNVLGYTQAMAAARQTVKRKREEAAAVAAGPLVTVRIAVEEYLVERDAKEAEQSGSRVRKRDARSRLTRYVFSDTALADTSLHELTDDALAQWRDGLPNSLAKSTIRRLSNDFRAALNRAAGRYRKRLPETFGAMIRAGLAAPPLARGRARATSGARRQQVLPVTEVRKIIEAARDVDAEDGWGGDLYRIIAVLAATGARFSQVARLTVGDVQPAKLRLIVPSSFKGGNDKEEVETPVPVGEDVLAALRPAVAGRKRTEVLLLRPRWRQVKPAEWMEVGRGSWGAASELTRPWAAIIARAKLPATLVPYCLRHSSIVRNIKAGLPVRLIAALHDTSTAIIERNYSHEIASALDGLAARAVTQLLPMRAGIRLRLLERQR